MRISEIIKILKANSNPEDIPFMAKYGITPERTFGTKIPVLRSLAREIGSDHDLALGLWDAGYRETRILASMIDDPSLLTGSQMEDWAREFDYWEICDQCVMNLFGRSTLAWKKAHEWSGSEHEGTKRAAFVLMARLAVAEKQAPDEPFERFLTLIAREANDDRNDVKKAVNWALRQIGKRNAALNKKAIGTAIRIQKIDSRAAKWVAADALRELTGEKVQKRLKK